MDATLKICMRDVVGEATEETASIDEQKDVPTKKDPEDGLLATNYKCASSEVNTCSK